MHVRGVTVCDVDCIDFAVVGVSPLLSCTSMHLGDLLLSLLFFMVALCVCCTSRTHSLCFGLVS